MAIRTGPSVRSAQMQNHPRKTHMHRRFTLAVTAATTLLLLPASAGAKGGGPQPPPPAPGGPACATLTSDAPSQVLSGGAGRSISLSWTVGNCSAAPQTVTVRATPTTFRVVDSAVVFCAGQTFTVGSVTLKPGEKRSLKTVAPADACYVPTNSLGVNYDATAGNGVGAVLASAFNTLTIRARA
jgi:hypothetical protein